MFVRRDYQIRGAELATAHVLAGVRDSYLLLVSPTGTGKSVIELDTLAACPGTVLVTPSPDIVSDLCEKAGWSLEDAEAHGLWTPIRLRNLLMRGEAPRPTGIIWDECHHQEATSWKDLSALSGDPPQVGFTATPYRGNPRGTAALLARWGEPVPLLTLGRAVAEGWLNLPECSVVPLVDDDVIEVKDGEFSIHAASETIASRVTDAVRLLRTYFKGVGVGWDVPTMLAVPSTEAVRFFIEELERAGLPTVAVTGETRLPDRQEAFRRTIARETLLVQIKVVGEGVDLPLRRLVDLRPLMSPTAWLQMFGRITRPSDSEPAQYVCCCRNLFRHAYLLEGLVPPAKIAEGEAAFGGPSARSGYRAVGLEGVGRFKPADIKFLDGTTGQFFCISSVANGQVFQYSVLVHPCLAEPLIAKREFLSTTDPRKRGKWQRVDKIPDLTGFGSVPPSAITPKMKAWWEGAPGPDGRPMRGAEFYGLDPRAKVTKKNFAALPVLANTGVRFGVGTSPA